VFTDYLAFGTGRPYKLAMAGGTRAYQNVHGQARIIQLTPTHFRWVVKIKR
jgi:hypothetical protein